MRTVIWLGVVGIAIAGGTAWCTIHCKGLPRLEIAMLVNGRQPGGAEARLERPPRLEIATDYRFPELESRLVSLAPVRAAAPG